MNFKELISQLQEVNQRLRESAIRAVNTSLTIRNWFFGFYIVEFEQNGSDRAGYGKQLLFNISQELRKAHISNTNERELRRFRQFYLIYRSAFHYINTQYSIRGLLPPELDKSEGSEIRELPTPELEITDSYYEKLFNSISYTHFVELIRIDDSVKRTFYEKECIRGVWSVAELKRQIGSILYERTSLSENKDKVLSLTHQNAVPQSVNDIIRDPYIFEFIGLKQQEVFKERDLEGVLLDQLSSFLLELGKGFCFEARQKRILIDNEHHFVDLVFYHRVLHCNVLVELKTERFNHTHSGQLNLYLEYYKKYEMHEGDNPPIGILLCTEKDAEHVAFATAGIEDKIFVSKYLVELPDKKELEQFIMSRL